MPKSKSSATKQATKHQVIIDKGNPKAGKGGVIPPKDTRFGGKDANPRHNGAWKKEDTLRYKFQQMAKLSRAELAQAIDNPNYSETEQAIAMTILEIRDIKEPLKRWQALEGMMNQDGGYPKQQVENQNMDMTPILPKIKKEKK